ncbi:MAG: tetratricopeptide repeat protein, partial [Cytophagaceae bacterium]|nr:tetratricopeptide repeat protein [Cytophagaceae bacterium]
MKFYTLFWLWLFGTIGSTRSSGQGPCLDRQIVWQQVNTQRVSEQTLSTWQRQWQACGLATDSVYGQVLFRLANLASQRAADDATLRWAGQALRVFQRLPQGRNPKLLFETRALLGKSYLFKNEYALARLHFEWILRQPFKAALRVPVRTSHYRLVSILREQGDYEAALRHADAGIDLAESGRDSLPLVNLHYEKALTLNRSGRYSEALQAGTQTARLAERFGIISAQIRSTELLAMIYSKLRQAPEAVGFYQKTIRLCQDNRQPIASSTFTNLGFAYYVLWGDYEKAIYYYQKALGAENDPYQRSRILNNLGAAFWQKHDFKTALQTYQQAFQALFPNFDPHNLTRNPAPEVMRRVARKEYLLTLTQDKADTWLAWAKATHNRTYLRHALATYRTADQMIDFMRWEHVGEGSKKFWREKTHQLYENAIEACHRLDQPEDAFYFFEKSRAALLADRLNELGASQLLTPADQKREADLQKTVNDLRQKVGDLKVGDKTADSLRQKLLVEEETQTAF